MSKETTTTSTATTTTSNPQTQTQAQSQETKTEEKSTNIKNISEFIELSLNLDKEIEKLSTIISDLPDTEFDEMIKLIMENKQNLSALLSRINELGFNIEAFITAVVNGKKRRYALLKAIDIIKSEYNTENNNEEEITMSIYKTENKNSKKEEAFRKNVIENIDFDAVAKAPVEVLTNEYAKWIKDYGYDVVHKCVAELNNQHICAAEAKVISMVMSGGGDVDSIRMTKKKEKPLLKILCELFDKIYKDLKGSDGDLEDDVVEVIENLRSLNKKFGPETIKDVWRTGIQGYNPNTNCETRIRGESAKGIFIDCLREAGCLSNSESADAIAECNAAINRAKRESTQSTSKKSFISDAVLNMIQHASEIKK